MSEISSYTGRNGKTLWKFDVRVTAPDGTVTRLRRRSIPTKEAAQAHAAKAFAEAYEHARFPGRRPKRLTVEEAWELFRPVCERQHKSFKDEKARMKKVLAYFGRRQCTSLNVADVNAYRAHRARQLTNRGTPPRCATVDYEVEVLKRTVKYAVEIGRLAENPIARAKLLKEPNVRRRVIDEEGFQKLYAAATLMLRPIMVIAFDTGMRKMEILQLRWTQVDEKAGTIRLAPQDTKGGEHRLVPLSARAKVALYSQARTHPEGLVFCTRTGKPRRDLNLTFKRAARKAGFEDLWFHDLRRSFVTNARRKGVPESVVMRMSGHRTRSVFDRYNIVNEDDVWTAFRMLEAARGQSTGNENESDTRPLLN